MRESFSWPLAVGVLNLMAQTLALVLALLSLLFGRDLFPQSALVAAVLEPTGLTLILICALLASHDPELQRIRQHVTQMETPPRTPVPPS
jgi:hypothetical protein